MISVKKNIKYKPLKEEGLKKTQYYYIDESGHINNNSKVFIHGCIKTDSPYFLESALEDIKKDIHNELYYSQFLKIFKVTGFHAVDNHFDIRTLLYKKLITLNWRAYFILVNKESKYFEELQIKEEHEIFKISLSKLLYNRLRKEKESKNMLKFETIDLAGKSFKNVLNDLFETWSNKFNCEYQIVKKEDEINLGIIDYLNYIIYRIISTNDKDETMRRNFHNLAPKMALIHIVNTNTYLSRTKEEITIENLLNNW